MGSLLILHAQVLQTHVDLDFAGQILYNYNALPGIGNLVSLLSMAINGDLFCASHPPQYKRVDVHICQCVLE